MFGTTTKLSMLFQVVITCTLERILFLELGLALTEINIKKYTNMTIKTLKM